MGRKAYNIFVWMLNRDFLLKAKAGIEQPSAKFLQNLSMYLFNQLQN